MKEDFGLVLAGGGAKGAYEIGAVKALEELGIKITAVTGTSVGALNGVMVAQHEIEKAYELWHNLKLSQIMNIDEEILNKLTHLEIKPVNLRYYLRIFKEIITEGGIDVTPLQNLIKKYVNEEKLRKSDIIFGMVTVSFTDLKALELFVEDIPAGEVADYLFASANFPLFRSAKIGEKIYLDGGIYDNLPVSMLINRGYKSLITVQVGGMGRKRKVNLNNLHIINIEPKEYLGGTLDFNTTRIRQNLKLGYYDTYRIIKNLAGKYYYINMEKDEDYFVNYFSHLDPEIINKVAHTLNLKANIPSRRLLFEKILPILINIMKLPEDSSYQDLAVALAEKIAQKVKVDRFQIYTFEELINNIIVKYEQSAEFTGEKKSSLIAHFGLLSLFSGEKLLNKLVKNLLNEKMIKLLPDG